MEVSLEKTGTLEGCIVVNIQQADYADRVKKELKNIGKTRQIPGFRKGHIDMAQLQKRFGTQVKAEVLNDIASDAALKHIQDNKIDVLGQPIPVVEDEFDITATDFTFKYEIGFAPAVDLKLDQSVTLPYYNIAVSDEMIEEQSKALLNRAGEQVPSDAYGERALVKGTIVQLDGQGQPLEGGITVEEGILAPFIFKGKDEAAKFEGSKVGDKVVFDAFATCDGNEAEVSSMLHIDRKDVEKARGNFEITIKEFVVHKPAELGDDFYKKVFGPDVVHNEEEFKAQVVNMITRALQSNSSQLFTRTAEDYLMSTYGESMELPEAFLRKFILRTDSDMNEETVDDYLRNALPGIKWEIIENKAAEQLGVKVEEEDVKAFAHTMAIEQLNSYGMGHMADQMADYLANNILQDKKQHRQIVRQAFNANLFSAIRNAIKLDEKTVSLDEFRALIKELNGTTEEPEAAAPEA